MHNKITAHMKKRHYFIPISYNNRTNFPGKNVYTLHSFMYKDNLKYLTMRFNTEQEPEMFLKNIKFYNSEQR